MSGERVFCLLGIISYFWTILFVVLYSNSLRQQLVFLVSISHLSNLLGVVYYCLILFKSKQLRLTGGFQATGLALGKVVALVWFLFLGGKETSYDEWMINILVHYFSPLLFECGFQASRIRYPYPLPIYPVSFMMLYGGFLYAIGKLFLGYQIYWFLDFENWHFALAVIVAFMVSYVYQNARVYRN